MVRETSNDSTRANNRLNFIENKLFLTFYTMSMTEVMRVCLVQSFAV